MTTKEDREQIKSFVDNEAMFKAVERVLNPTDEELAMDVQTALDDAAFGRAVKAWVGARELVKTRLAELRRIASTNPQRQPQNEAR